MKYFHQDLIDDLRPIFGKIIKAWKALPDDAMSKITSDEDSVAAFSIWLSSVVDADLNDLVSRLTEAGDKDHIYDQKCLVSFLCAMIDADRNPGLDFTLPDEPDDVIELIDYIDIRTWTLMRLYESYFRTYWKPQIENDEAARERYADAANETVALFESRQDWLEKRPVAKALVEREPRIVGMLDKVFEIYISTPAVYEKNSLSILTEPIPEEVLAAELIAPKKQ